jgi:hypothetical protein
MADNDQYPVDPMAAFYAAVTAVENGKVGEVELEFRNEHEDHQYVVTMNIRREVRPMGVFLPTNPKEE